MRDYLGNGRCTMFMDGKLGYCKDVDSLHIWNMYNWLEFEVQSIQRAPINKNKDSPIKKISRKYE